MNFSAIATAINKVKYAGAVPMCGVLGDTELFNYFAGYQVAAQQLAGVPLTKFPATDFEALTPVIQSALWSSFPTQTNAQGDRLKNAVMNLSGRDRPFFKEGWADANRLRRDGLRWIPVTSANISIPVVSIHTLGDLFVPFKMEQVYFDRAKAKGTDKFLVQRAIRDVGHCAFTAAEATTAFDDMVKWEAGGPKPAGDDVKTAATVASPAYGCGFTKNTPSAKDYTSPAGRARFQSAYLACPAN